MRSGRCVEVEVLEGLIRRRRGTCGVEARVMDSGDGGVETRGWKSGDEENEVENR